MFCSNSNEICKGYMTLEAAFLIPWVVFITAGLVYLGFFEYDRCLLFQDSYILATQTAAYIGTTSDKQERLSAGGYSQYGDKYMAINGIQFNAQVTDKKVEIEAATSVLNPFANETGVVPNVDLNINDKIIADNFSFTKRLRTIRGIGRVVGAMGE